MTYSKYQFQLTDANIEQQECDNVAAEITFEMRINSNFQNSQIPFENTNTVVHKQSNEWTGNVG